MNIYRVYCSNMGYIEDSSAPCEYIIACDNETEAELISRELYIKDNYEGCDFCDVKLMTETDNGYKIVLA